MTSESINNSSELNIIPVKRKKGRPRKIKTEEELIQNQQPQEKKKRGRKKKEPKQEEIKQKKKRGRKAAIKFFSSSIRKQIPLTTVIEDNNNYILHLNINKANENTEVNDLNTENNIETENIEDDCYETLSETIQKNDNKELFVLFDSLKLKDEVISEVKNTIINNSCNSDSDKNSENSDITDTNSELSHSSQSINTNQSCKSNISQNTELDLRKIYENRISMRERQDKLLIDKLESLHKDEKFLNKLSTNKSNNSTYNSNVDHNKNILNNNKIKKLKAIQQDNIKKGFFQMYYDLIINDDWTKLENELFCWWCCHSFDSVPIGIPLNYNSKINKFITKGIFCSFGCMQAYKKNENIICSDDLIRYLYKKLTGITVLDKDYLKCAPPRIVLKRFGGIMTIEEFREASSRDKIYKMVEYPLIPSREYMEIVDIANVKNANINVFEDAIIKQDTQTDNVKKFNDAKLRLSSQIEKATITVGNTIDKFINLS
jgi:hypothetical protein